MFLRVDHKFHKKKCFYFSPLAIFVFVACINISLYVFLDDWMCVPQQIPDCPPGLEYLTSLDRLFVMQKASLTEALLGFEKNNKYIIKNSFGQNVRSQRWNGCWKVSTSSSAKFFFAHNFRYTWLLKIRIAVHEIAVAIVGHSIWKCWICITMKLLISIVHWLVPVAVFRAACNRSKYHHRPAILLAVLPKNGHCGSPILISKMQTTKLCYASKGPAVIGRAVAISNSR